MTSSNINKIVRNNITLKPWILSKNTSEIVNACVQKIYKQTQNNFKNDSSKIAAAKPENKGPIRALKSQERVRYPLSTNVSRTKKGAAANNSSGDGNAGAAAGNSGGLAIGVSERLSSNAAANNRRGAVANLTAQRKLLKSSPNYKIYTSRRFGSSASSSNASIFRRNDERHRSTTQTSQLNYLLRTYATQLNARRTYTKDSVLPKFIISARNQHMQSHTDVAAPSHVAHLSSVIQRDLMPINSAIKDRIALGRPRLSKMAAQKAKNHDPMSGWHHPPAQELFLSRFNQDGIASTEFQDQHRRMKHAKEMRQYEHLRQFEKRNTLLGSVGKKAMQRIQNEFEGNFEVATPHKLPHRRMRQQTSNCEESYVTRVMRQQADEADASAKPSTLETFDATQPMVVTPQASQLTSAAHKYAVSHSRQSTPYSQTSSEKRYVSRTPSTTPPIDAPAATSPSTPAKTVSLSAPATAQPEATQPPPLMSKQFLRITKHSATSQLSRAAAQAAAQNQMRFNHSAHLNKFWKIENSNFQ